MSDTEQLRKARGAFFTPPEISRFISRWAVRTQRDVVLEPSCGEASFLLEAGNTLRSLGGGNLRCCDQLHGVELHDASAAQARTILLGADLDARVNTGDFFEYQTDVVYDAIIGNPPYIRYQNYAGTTRARSLEAALSQGVRLNGLASSWAAFTIHACRFLKDGGRLGLVLPAELLSVNYAAPVRRFLLERFGKIRLVMFEQRVFPGVLEEVVLLLAEGKGGASCFEVYQASDLKSLDDIDSSDWKEHRPLTDEKWTPALLSSSLFDAYRELSCGPHFETLNDWGDTYLGIVTGNNAFFALSGDEVKRYRLKPSELLRISPPGSRHLKGGKFTESAWSSAVRESKNCFLFYPAERPSAAAMRYIAHGEAMGADSAYKCTARNPWYRVPLVKVPDLFLTYMNHDRPRFIENDANVHILNSLYGISLRHGRKTLGRKLMPLAALNSLTLLGAEMVGRSYGGGMLKLEPKEAGRLPVPSKDLIEKNSDALSALVPHVFNALRGNDFLTAVAMVDRVVLGEGMNLPESERASLRQARETLFHRRKTRGKGSNVTNR